MQMYNIAIRFFKMCLESMYCDYSNIWNVLKHHVQYVGDRRCLRRGERGGRERCVFGRKLKDDYCLLGLIEMEDWNVIRELEVVTRAFRHIQWLQVTAHSDVPSVRMWTAGHNSEQTGGLEFKDFGLSRSPEILQIGISFEIVLAHPLIPLAAHQCNRGG